MSIFTAPLVWGFFVVAACAMDKLVRLEDAMCWRTDLQRWAAAARRKARTAEQQLRPVGPVFRSRGRKPVAIGASCPLIPTPVGTVDSAQTAELKYTLESLLEVKGVGPSLARLILAAAPRCREELLKVKGVGKSKADLLRGVVY